MESQEHKNTRAQEHKSMKTKELKRTAFMF